MTSSDVIPPLNIPGKSATHENSPLAQRALRTNNMLRTHRGCKNEDSIVIGHLGREELEALLVRPLFGLIQRQILEQACRCLESSPTTV